jgi:hypothetical protein
MRDYSLIRFYKDLKNSLEELKKSKLTYRIISKNFLGMKNKWHINDKILHSKGDLNYIIPWNLISRYENSLKRKLREKDFLSLKDLFQNLRKFKLKSPKQKQLVNTEYFKSLDNKNKAYFYGWLFADGHLEKSHRRLIIDVDVKDAEIIKRFVKEIEISPNKVFYRRRYKGKKLCRSLVLIVKNKLFTLNLYKVGFPTGKKSGKIRFPSSIAEKKGLAWAFLLGYFDGDGSHGRTYPNDLKKSERKFLRPYIKSNSIEFLKDVKSIFNIPNKISKEKELNLGSDLYKRLLKNYKYSLERKRFDGYYTKQEIYNFRINNLKPQWSKSWKWFKFSKTELENLWSKGWNDKMITEYHLKRFNIPIKERTVQEWRKKWKFFHTDKSFKRANKRLIIKKFLRLNDWSLVRIYCEKFGYKYDVHNSRHHYRFKKRLRDWFIDEKIDQKVDIVDYINEKYGV